MAIITVDQSGKVEKTNVDTVIAATNSKSYIILLPSSVKRGIAEAIKQGKHKRFRRYPIMRIFTACVYLCLEKLKSSDSVVIDHEYKSIENEIFIRNRLTEYIRHRYPLFRAEQIGFVSIGKQSFAHKLAIEAYRKQKDPDKVITENELLGLL